MDKEKTKILREKYAGSFGGKRDNMNFQDEATTLIDGKTVRKFYTAIIKKRNRQRRIFKMLLAKDGKPFDIDNIGTLMPGEVEVIQFLRPDGTRRRMGAVVGKEHVEMAKDLILSAEELRSGEVVVYARRIGEPTEAEICEIAVNGQGEKSPSNCLKRLIEKKAKEERWKKLNN